MKKLILCAITCLFLTTSCFETTIEVTVAPETPLIDFNIMECEEVIKFIDYATENAPREPRPILEKYQKNNEIFFKLDKEGEPYVDDQVEVLYYNSNCEVVCSSNYGFAGGDCPSDFNDGLEFIETIWQDER